MAAANKTFEGIDTKDIFINKKIAELKKRIILADGQKKATAEEWLNQEKKTIHTIADLKKEIKSLIDRLKNRNTNSNEKYSKEACEIVPQINCHESTEVAQKTLETFDLRTINQTKKYDLLEAKVVERKDYYNKLLRQRAELLAIPSDDIEKKDKRKRQSTAESCPLNTKQAPLTAEEEENRQLICHLENEIIRMNIQWSQAEHVRKKYKAIQGSLMSDAEKFEKSLLELENSLGQQSNDIDNMNKLHHEAIHMRDATKIFVMRQEHSSQSAAKARSKSAFDFRQQVDDHKVELERLERKLLTTAKTAVQHGSMESLNDAQLTDKASPISAKTGNNVGNQLEITLKLLMQVTGATSPSDVFSRFNTQKEATTRLSYLRTVTEAEKRQLETQRDELTASMESLRFSDSKENEVNQEYLEQLKVDISQRHSKENELLQLANRSKIVLNSIKITIIDLIQKLEGIDNNISISVDDEINENTSTTVLMQLLEEKLKSGLMAAGSLFMDDDLNLEVNVSNNTEMDENFIDVDKLNINLKLSELKVPSTSVSAQLTARSTLNTDVKQSSVNKNDPSTPYPICYTNLLAGRTTGVSTSSTPGQSAQPAVSDEEADVPSRNLLKRQALIMVDSKARRKGFRAATKRK